MRKSGPLQPVDAGSSPHALPGAQRSFIDHLPCSRRCVQCLTCLIPLQHHHNPMILLSEEMDSKKF